MSSCQYGIIPGTDRTQLISDNLAGLARLDVSVGTLYDLMADHFADPDQRITAETLLPDPSTEIAAGAHGPPYRG
jgi:hypothetical protein